MKLTATISMAVLMLPLALSTPLSAQAPDHAGGPERGAEARETAQERRERAQAEASERQAQVRQDVCERQQDRLEEVLPRMATSAVRLLDVMDDMYERVEGFYASGQLTVANHEELTGEVDEAQVNAQSAVEALEGYVVELDCDQPGLGTQLDGHRQLVGEARDDLRDYRDALVGLIQALRAEAAEDSAETGDNDNNDEEGNDEE